MTVNVILLVFVVCSLQIVNIIGITSASELDSNPYKHSKILDKNGYYHLEWLVDWPENRIFFNVTVKTRGYVGLGLSRKDKMLGADIVIGGVLPNGQPYFSDRHAIGNQLPVEDLSQDWTLHQAWESKTHTFLSFSRNLETCDQDHDLPINDDATAILWAFGEKDDDIEYHYQNRGVVWSYLLDPDLTPPEFQNRENPTIKNKGSNALGDWKIWQISGQQLVPEKETTYMCSIHKVPNFNTNQHAVGFTAILPTDLERRHIHHFLVQRCIPPEGQSADRIFQHLLGHKEECYILGTSSGIIPAQYCTEVFYVYAVGQNPTFLPDHVGMPLQPNEYFFLQMHFDNPNQLSNLRLNYAMEIFYTDNLRKHDAGVLALGELTPSSPSIIVPPNSLAYETYGHCAAECTKSMIPTSGIRVFAAFPHTHLAGRSLRLVHIRSNKELPWIINDNNYNFNYQQIRILREERVILPGDQLYVRCTFANTDRQGNATIGGYSTREEMCIMPIWYYNRIPDRPGCRSELRADEYRNFIQIYNTSWSDNEVENVVTAPQANRGLLVSQVANWRIDWTLENRRKLQEFHRHSVQISICPSNRFEAEEVSSPQRSSLQAPGYSQRFDISSQFQRKLTTLSSIQPKKLKTLTLNRPSVSDSVNYFQLRNRPGVSYSPPTYEFPSVLPKKLVNRAPSDCHGTNRIKH